MSTVSNTTAEIPYPATPELDKQTDEILQESRIIEMFLDFLQEKDITLVDVNNNWLSRHNHVRLLHEYHGLDMDKMEQERKLVLDYARKCQRRDNANL